MVPTVLCHHDSLPGAVNVRFSSSRALLARLAMLAALSGLSFATGKAHVARAALEAQATASRESYRLADLRYRNGIASYLNLLDAQRALFTSEQALTQTRLLERLNQVELYKALGGGWNDTAPSATPVAAKDDAPAQ